MFHTPEVASSPCGAAYELFCKTMKEGSHGLATGGARQSMAGQATTHYRSSMLSEVIVITSGARK